jgi:mannose-1-phosphate guanylyltransferase
LFTGIHVLDPGLLERLPAGASDSVRDLYAPLIAEGEHVHGVRVAGAWYDLGDPAAYLKSQLRILAQGFRGFPRRAALVAPGARLARDARVTASVVGRGVRIGARSRVERSVVWPGARIDAGARVFESILSHGVVVRSGDEVRRRVVTPHASRAL